MATLVSYHEKEHIGIVTLNRPEAANALSLQLLDEMNLTVEKIENSPSVRCIIITGEGEKAFCAGADLKERRTMTENQVIETVKYIGDTITRVENLPIPVIAAINGVAFGGGLELALACDFRIAAEQVKVGLTETSLAIIPGAGGTQRLPRLIGAGRAKSLIFTAKPIDITEAYQLGIIEIVEKQGNLLEEAKQIAKRIASNGPIALRQAKAAINEGLDTDLQSGLAIEHEYYKKTITTEDRLEGLQAFKEKRKPEYKGK